MAFLPCSPPHAAEPLLPHLSRQRFQCPSGVLWPETSSLPWTCWQDSSRTICSPPPLNRRSSHTFLLPVSSSFCLSFRSLKMLVRVRFNGHRGNPADRHHDWLWRKAHKAFMTEQRWDVWWVEICTLAYFRVTLTREGSAKCFHSVSFKTWRFGVVPQTRARHPPRTQFGALQHKQQRESCKDCLLSCIIIFKVGKKALWLGEAARAVFAWWHANANWMPTRQVLSNGAIFVLPDAMIHFLTRVMTLTFLELYNFFPLSSILSFHLSSL